MMTLADIGPEQYRINFSRIERAISFILDNWRSQPSLGEMAGHSGLSEFHFQKLFKAYAGISPKRFLQFITAKSAEKYLDNSSSVLDTSIRSGLSSTSRLYDLFITAEAVTPGQYKSRGEGLEIFYDFYVGPFGVFLLATTASGICALKFTENDNMTGRENWLKRFWKNAAFHKSRAETERTAANILSVFTGRRINRLDLHLRGSNFELKTWQALLSIPDGSLVSYRTLAGRIGSDKAFRAVGSAVGRNPVPYLVPCHRVIKSNGIIGQYAEGPSRKALFICREISDSQNTEKPLS